MSTNDTSGNQSDAPAYKDEETLRRLYWDEGNTASEVGDILGVSKKTVLRWMSRNYIPRRDKTTRPATFSTDAHWYERWTVNQSDGIKVCTTHRLLAVCEYGFQSVAGLDVHHKKNIPWLNYSDNIELISKSEHGRRHNTGENNYRFKITDEMVQEIREIASNSGITQEEIANRYDICQSLVSRIINKKRRFSDC